MRRLIQLSPSGRLHMDLKTIAKEYAKTWPPGLCFRNMLSPTVLLLNRSIKGEIKAQQQLCIEV